MHIGILTGGGDCPGMNFATGGADVSAELMAYVQALGLDGPGVIGGDGSMAIADKLSRLGLPMVGVPKTIDNDLCLTDHRFGFDSAVAIEAEALDRLATMARSLTRFCWHGV